MTHTEYMELAKRTKSADMHIGQFGAAFGYGQGAARMPNAAERENIDMLHASVGMVTEAGELLDAWKKTLFYGKMLDFTNYREELGDILWYVAIGAAAAGTTFEELMAQNIAKLRTRFPDKFDAHHALNRDLFAERATLEQRPAIGNEPTHE